MRKMWTDRRWRLRAVVLIFVDALCVALSGFAALWIRFECSIPLDVEMLPFAERLFRFSPLQILIALLFFAFFHMYTSLWKYASINEMLNIILAVGLSSVVNALVIYALDVGLPRSYHFIYMVILGVFMVGIRLSYRLLRHFWNRQDVYRRGKKTANVMVIGAGDAGAALIKDLSLSKHVDRCVRCVIDDNPAKQGCYIQGTPIVGGTDAILDSVARYDIEQIVIAIPSASKQAIRRILEECKHSGCDICILPGQYQLVNGEVSVSKLRKVEIADLLGRDAVNVDLDKVLGYVKDKVILVTGGGGSIGSELCRQLAGHGVRRLIILDIYENNAYDIQQELRKKHPELDLVVLIGSVRNTLRINSIMEKYHPDVVYHAAAHKHVPLMEDSPNEAIKNNVMGTYKTAKAAAANGVKRFVLISTDKAVNPTNIMGASKRLCEMVVQMMNRKSLDTEFVAVRFGNVLGSNGSVIPLFKKQIEAGGPVTVTHPDIIRYFMTIPEAVSLVLQAGGYAKGGEIFILDMGEPVRIAELAENLIRLSGYKVGENIEIVYTGLRPGEKLYEELLMAEEGMKETENKLIHIGKPIDMDDEWFEQKLAELDEASCQETGEMKRIVAEIVPTYHPDTERAKA